MKEIFRDYLFDKGILVAEKDWKEQNRSDTEILCMLVTLGRKCGIRIRHGYRMLTEETVKYVVESCCQYVPEAFYRGFPESVRRLTPDQLLFDQMVSYAKTYGLGMFDGNGEHSMIEKFERTAFREETEPREFCILTVEEAQKKIREMATDLVKSPRPLSALQMEFLKEAITEYNIEVLWCGCLITAVDLLIETRDLRYAEHFLHLPDVIKVLERIQYLHYGSWTTNQLNLRNQDRKLLTKTIDLLIDKTCRNDDQWQTVDCFEKRETWKGLLHHLHYKPKNDFGRNFVSLIRNSITNLSAYATADGALKTYGNIVRYADILKRTKGSGAVLRNLNYILSRCTNEKEVREVFECLE